MPLESQFSVQVTQPYLNEPFPVRSTEPHHDRIFKHITFREDTSDFTLRLRAINHNYITASTVLQKHVHTNIAADDARQEIFRVKAVLSQSDCGIDESYWVTQKSMDSGHASTHNQYRIRGVSHQNWKSDWVYSELRDYDNDLIIYNMLYDIIDLLMTVHDDQIDYFMDYIVRDIFVKIIKEKAPEIATSLDLEDLQAVGLVELLSILADQADANPKEQIVAKLGESFLALSNELKKEFRENVLSSPTEFAELYRVYKLFDLYRSKNQEAFQLLMEIFLEERLEKLMGQTNIEVLLQNDAEMGIYLNSTYEFDIKSELIKAIYSASPDDSFVTKLNDAVQLLSEPIVFENLVYKKDETVEKFLRLALTELYAPMVATDVRLLELEHALEDAHKVEALGSIVEYATFIEDYEIRTMLLYDVVESAIKGDLNLERDYEISIIEHILGFMKDPKKALLIDYNFDEFLEVFMNVGESFRQAYNKEFGKANEQKTVQLVDRSQTSHTIYASTLTEAYQAALRDTHHLAQLKSMKDTTERTHVGLIEHVLHQYHLFKQAVNEALTSVIQSRMTHQYHISKAFMQENIQAALNENARHQSIEQDSKHAEYLFANQIDEVLLADILQYFVAPEYSQVMLRDIAAQQDMVWEFVWKDSQTALPEELYYNLFQHHLRDPNRYRILESKYVELSHDLRDLFIIDGTDLVQYALGDMGEDWPLGVFRLGINTLKGEVSSS
jgi:hypothetical protein